MRLTREVDLSNVGNATLSYWTWYDIEEDWDYAYVSVSEDGGATWTTLRTPSSTDTSPNNSNLGWGYTGQSGDGFGADWIEESVDLTPYAGKKILLRFEIVHDLAVNLPGFAIDDIRIPEIGFSDDAESDSGWSAEGWVRTNNFVPQTFIAQLIGYNKDGSISVARLPINDDNTAVWDIPLSGMSSAVIALSATAVKTSEPAWYNWEVVEKP
jgi:bacillopeptidase F (M6 metalloprotease family)